MRKGDLDTKLIWRCGHCGKVFKASPRLILLGGHWCPHCYIPKKSWNYDSIAKTNPFIFFSSLFPIWRNKISFTLCIQRMWPQLTDKFKYISRKYNQIDKKQEIINILAYHIKSMNSRNNLIKQYNDMISKVGKTLIENSQIYK